MSKPTRKESLDSWINSKWRPMMGWVYMITCITDFILFPVLWSILQAAKSGAVTNQWVPITLHGAGLFHLAMGTILGVAAWSRGQEKLMAFNQGFGMNSFESETTVIGQTPTSSNVKMPKVGKPVPSRQPVDETFQVID